MAESPGERAPHGAHAPLSQFRTTYRTDAAIWRECEWGDMRVGYETYLEDFEDAGLLKGLPDDRCPVPHWGQVLAGRLTVHYPDHDEVVGAGEAYYMAPGHTMSAEAGTVLVEFSPKEPFRELTKIAEANFRQTQSSGEQRLF